MKDQNKIVSAALDSVWRFTGALLLGPVVGFFIDRHFHTSPWGIIALSALGFAAGLWSLFRQ